ncbi:hypothetical protein BASA81_016784 [Batrachochytrium salamandrivorans]|nr:hypothetical protein BASA81_016784 [Batrachochytrium salamandrivorans]
MAEQDTEWNDVLRDKGILPPKPKELEITEDQIAEMIEKTVHERQYGKALEDRTLDELDELEDLEDDRVLESYRRQRLADMQAQLSAEKFGSVLQISKPDYTVQVTDASKTAWVVVHLFQNYNTSCKLLNAILDRLAAKHRATKFCKIVADRLRPQNHSTSRMLQTIIQPARTTLWEIQVSCSSSRQVFVRLHMQITSNDLEMLPKEVMLFHSSLKVLDASFNAIVDIPVLFCQACTSLCILDLRGNRLTTFPKEIWRLLTLHTLHLGTNLLISIPYGSFSGLSELRTLDLCGNQIELIPADLFLSCPKLEWLDISHNRVSSIPNSIANATYLTHLNLSNNTIKEVPAAFGELHALVSFDISENTLEILAHNVFGYLQNLRILVLHHNRLTHLPSMDDLISLETLDISARKRNPSSEDLVELDTFTFTQTPSLLPASPYYLELAKKRSMKHKCNPITYPPQRECKAGLDSIMAYLRQTSATHAAYTDTTCHTFTSHTPSNYMSLTSPSSTNPIIKIDLERQMYADLSQNSNDENTFQSPTLTKALSPPSYSVDSLVAVEYVGALCFQKEYTIANQYLDAWTECRKASLSTPMDLVLCATHLANTVSLYKSLACPPETQLDLSSVAELLQALIRITIRFCRLRLLPLVQPAFLGDLFVALSNSAAVPEVVSANGFNKNPMIHAPDTASKRLIDMMQSLLELLDTNGPRWHAAESMASALCFVVDVAVWNTFIVERTVDVVLCLASLHRWVGMPSMHGDVVAPHQR